MNKMSIGVGGGGGRLPRKIKTWKFGSEFLVRNALVKDKAALGRWTRDQLIELGPTFVKLGQKRPRGAICTHWSSCANWKCYKMMYRRSRTIPS